MQSINAEAILTKLKSTHGITVDKDKLMLALDIDTIGEHLINASFYDPRFKQDFNFIVKVNLIEKK